MKINWKVNLVLSLCAGTMLMPPAYSAHTSPHGLSRDIDLTPLPVSTPGALDVTDQAMDKINKGDADGALILINQVLIKDPLNPIGYLLRGKAHQMRGDYINAMSDLEQVKVAPLQAGALSDHGYCFANLMEYQQALNDYNNSLALDNTSTDSALTFSRRAETKRNLKDLNGALADCAASLKNDPKNYDAYWARGKVYFDQLNYSQALADLNVVLQQDSNFAEAHFLKAQCLSQLGQKDEAASEYKTAQKLFQQSDDPDGVALAQKALQSLTASATAK